MKIAQDTVPSSIEQAVEALLAAFDEWDRQVIREGEPYYHFTCGMRVRNAWSLWQKDSPIVRDAIQKYGIAHGDDVSGLIFAWAFAKVRGQTFDPALQVEEYRKHWAKEGLTPLQAGGAEPRPAKARTGRASG